MSENNVDANKKVWRNTSRVSVGFRKGQFKKHSATVQKEKNAKKKADARKSLVETAVKSTDMGVLGGRELHEPSVLAEEMWCSNCDIPLSFRFAQSKVQKGLAHIYDIKCFKCNKIKSVKTGEVFRHGKSDLFVVNAKACAGILDAGLGETQFNLLLSAMDVDTVSDTLLKRYERIVGPKIEELAKESCSQVLQEKIALTRTANDIVVDK